MQRQGTDRQCVEPDGKNRRLDDGNPFCDQVCDSGVHSSPARRTSSPQFRVIALLPSLTDTDMVQNFEWFRWVMPTTPQKVDQTLIAGLEKEAPEILVEWQSHLAVWGNRLMPWLVENVSRLAAPLAENRQAPDARLREARADPR